jgi:hypothetical protein
LRRAGLCRFCCVSLLRLLSLTLLLFGLRSLRLCSIARSLLCCELGSRLFLLGLTLRLLLGTLLLLLPSRFRLFLAPTLLLDS